jgi:hypothetical protein
MICDTFHNLLSSPPSCLVHQMLHPEEAPLRFYQSYICHARFSHTSSDCRTYICQIYSAVLIFECRREKAHSCRHGQMTSIHDESCEGRYLMDATSSDSESQEVKHGQYEVRNTSG